MYHMVNPVLVSSLAPDLEGIIMNIVQLNSKRLQICHDVLHLRRREMKRAWSRQPRFRMHVVHVHLYICIQVKVRILNSNAFLEVICI